MSPLRMRRRGSRGGWEVNQVLATITPTPEPQSETTVKLKALKLKIPLTSGKVIRVVQAVLGCRLFIQVDQQAVPCLACLAQSHSNPVS